MVKRGGPSPQAWLFLGPEIGEKQAAIDEIRKKLSTPGEKPSDTMLSVGKLEETVYYAGETPVPVMVAGILNGSLFADLRLFQIKCAEAIKKKDEIDLLSPCLTSPPNDAYIILVSEETGITAGIEKTIPKDNKRIFWEISDSRKSQWVQTFFRNEGFSISSDGIETILELVENNTAALKQECSRLTVFLDKNKVITGEEAEKWLSHTREESVFTLFSRIAVGDLSRSLESARMLLEAKVAPQAIFAALSSCFRKLMNYIALKEAGNYDDAEYRKIGVFSPGAKRDYAAAASRYDSAGAESCLALTAEYDFTLRSSLSFPEQVLMDKYLFKIHACSSSKSARFLSRPPA